MLRIVDLLNNIGEDDSQLVDGSSQVVKLGRSVSAPERESKVEDNQDVTMTEVDEDEHAASCPEDKQSPHYTQTSARPRSYSSRTQEKASMKRSSRRLSPYSSQQQFMTIGNIVNPGEPTKASGTSFGPSKRAATSGKKRSTRSLFPELSDSERRAKQRLIVKRCYYKKINTIKSLRDEVDSLEQQFRSALRVMQQEDEAAKADGRGDDVKLRELFIDTLTTKESLREENIRLRRLADEYYMKNQGRLRQLLDSNRKDLILFTAVPNDN
ncbi:hypothetical protein BBO99_00000247 [Phytophthora kernoviae]|uniref:BZIP domain-containing protein n=2 Tax=Phytophthora kernoviae TaxID=325452 RepID=A0A3R7KPP2_9STRA|nr:hypothetical protein G195_004672 [Phytophthora kernoviae 00238/432]KAG2523254.1 hypothetical protein JM18_005833 [Phytophthora kernoviae]KAG2528839.1 hypothetical protein JM16_002475 [Phytophthora kernoviae]RLN21371.1 hypothetical protein BBI17_000343 [Phytophthora kernoviae]RLN85706.1 hypothetical protein BBO99_00000247 [Phytophthora kernoviae]